ncbi:hypothetical protein [Paraburkholderia sp. JPY419]
MSRERALAVVEVIEALRARIALHDLLHERHAPADDPRLNHSGDRF